MEFKEAYSHLTEGKKIYRRRWDDKTIYLEMNEAFEIKCYRQECIVFDYDLTVFDYSWIVLDEKDFFSFVDAIPLLLKGKKIRLEVWPKDTFVEADGSKRCLVKRGTCEYDFTPTFDCLSSNDWEIIIEEENVHRNLTIKDNMVTELR